MQIIDKDINEIKPYAKNAKKHPDEQVARIANSIREFGFRQPLVIDKNNVLVIGHGRLAAAKRLGYDTVPCLYADDLTDEQIKALRLADNKTNESDWDFDFLDVELDDITDIDMSQFGFDITTMDGFGEEFTLPDGEKSDMCQITFYLHENQKELIEYAMSIIGDDIVETFGNKNKHGNQIYEVVRQWAEQRK